MSDTIMAIIMSVGVAIGVILTILPLAAIMVGAFTGPQAGLSMLAGVAIIATILERA